MKYILPVLILSAASQPIFANTDKADNKENKVRLVISEKSNNVISGLSMSMSKSEKAPAKIKTVTVNKNDAEALVEFYKSQPGVENVERDIPVSTPDPMSFSVSESQYKLSSEPALTLYGDTPNDPEYPVQYSWFEPTPTYKGQLNIINGVKISNPKTKLKIGMTDSGFYDREDINYAGGYNFATINGNQLSSIFFEDYHNPSCTSPHGGSVAHIIGAETDNSMGVAGVVDADLYAARVMDCGSGYLSEMATGIRWLARDTSLDSSIPPIDSPVDIINISMGGISSTCPSYVQNAIDYANSKGIAVFAAAGNDTINVSDYTPANCNNVISVASVDRYGDQSVFSNYGNKIDVSALGEMVRSEGTSGYSYWFGTSFATPNVTAIAALAKQANPLLSVNDLYSYIKNTTRPHDVDATVEPLGTGIVDAENLMNAVNADSGESIPGLDLAINSNERIAKDAYKNVSYKNEVGNDIDLCQVFEVDSSLLEAPTGYENRSLYRVPQGQNYDISSATLIQASTEKRFVVHELDISTYDYGFSFCNADNSSCEGTILTPLKDDLIDTETQCK